MVGGWTKDRVDSLAPDAASIKAGLGLAKTAKWVSFAVDDRALWGECKGSGSKPYMTRVDLAEIAFKCSCPSRKFPCKHALGLLYLFAEEGSSFKTAEQPGWVAEWIAGRAQRAERKEERAKTQKPPDPEAQRKRAEKREQTVDSGIADLRIWMSDLIRGGLIQAQSKPYAFWDAPARRLIDSQAPGLARRVRSLAGMPSSGEDWAVRLLDALGRIHLLSVAWNRLAELPEPMRETVRTEIGFQTGKDEVLSGEAVTDRWTTTAVYVEEDIDGLRVQRAWLHGEKTRRIALILSFAHRSGGVFDFSIPHGSSFEAELTFYPAAYPLRALLRDRKGEIAEASPPRLAASLDEAMDAYAEALALDPWIERFPVAISEAVPIPTENGWRVLDKNGRQVKLKISAKAGWRLMAASGGRPLWFFGEWNGDQLRALSAVSGGLWSKLDGDA